MLINQRGVRMEDRFENFTFLILKVSKLIQKIKNIEMQEYGLKAVHVMCIYYLMQKAEGMTNKELVACTLEDKAAISRAVSLLDERGYVILQEKTYNAPILLTKAGEQLGKEIYKKADNAVHTCGDSLTETEREQFYKSLRLISDNLLEYYCKLEENNEYN